MLSLFVCLFSGRLEAATINVPADYATITLAITAASNGDTIQVAAGTYSESITVNRQVTIQGAGASTTTINGTTNQQAVNITSSSVTIQGFTLTVSNSSLDKCIFISGSYSNITISNNILQGSGPSVEYGISVTEVGGAKVTNLTVSNNTISNITLYGMYLRIQSSTVNSNTITGPGSSATGNGIRLADADGSGNNTISNNTISGFSQATVPSGAAIWLSDDNDSSSIYNNTLYSCYFGVFDEYNNSLNIYNNRVLI